MVLDAKRMLTLESRYQGGTMNSILEELIPYFWSAGDLFGKPTLYSFAPTNKTICWLLSHGVNRSFFASLRIGHALCENGEKIVRPLMERTHLSANAFRFGL